MIIGITGHKYNGKDTIGEYLTKYSYICLSFAEPIKVICKILFGFSVNQLFGNEKELIDPYWNITPRRAMQYIGTDLLRDQLGKLVPIGQDIWIEVLRKKIKDLGPKALIVITDVRFDNEVKFIKQMGGIIWRVTRPILEISDNHESEKSIDNLPVDHEILNDSSLEDLYKKVDLLLDTITQKN